MIFHKVWMARASDDTGPFSGKTSWTATLRIHQPHILGVNLRYSRSRWSGRSLLAILLPDNELLYTTIPSPWHQPPVKPAGSRKQRQQQRRILLKPRRYTKRLFLKAPALAKLPPEIMKLRYWAWERFIATRRNPRSWRSF